MAIRQIEQIKQFQSEHNIDVNALCNPTPYGLPTEQDMIGYASQTLRRMWYVRRNGSDGRSWKHYSPAIHTFRSHELYRNGDTPYYDSGKFDCSLYLHEPILRDGLVTMCSRSVAYAEQSEYSAVHPLRGGLAVSWPDSPKLDMMKLEPRSERWGYSYTYDTQSEWLHGGRKPMSRRINIAMIMGIGKQNMILLQHYNDGRIEYTFDREQIFMFDHAKALAFAYNAWSNVKPRLLQNEMKVKFINPIVHCAPPFISELNEELEARMVGA